MLGAGALARVAHKVFARFRTHGRYTNTAITPDASRYRRRTNAGPGSEPDARRAARQLRDANRRRVWRRYRTDALLAGSTL